MRVSRLLAAGLVLMFATSAFAQGEWIQYVNKEEGFCSNFPNQPKVEEIIWTTPYDFKLPGKVFSGTDAIGTYSVTSVDYRGLEKLGMERAKACPAGAETCLGNQVGGSIGPGYWKMDMRGAMTSVIFKYTQRPGKITELTYQFQELVEGYFVHLTNPDGSRTNAYITMHEGHLYIWEGTTKKGMPEPGLFMGSVGFADPEGQGVRYQSIYSQAYHGTREVPLPARAMRGNQGAGCQPN